LHIFSTSFFTLQRFFFTKKTNCERFFRSCPRARTDFVYLFRFSFGFLLPDCFSARDLRARRNEISFLLNLTKYFLKIQF